MNRRKTLLAMLGATLSRVALGKLPESNQTALATRLPPPSPISAADDSEHFMQEDLARMGSHEYSDEGIPVFLACEIFGEEAVRSATSSMEVSRRVSADLRRYGDAWARMHPDAPDGDVSKIIEVLAERDFALGDPRATP